MRIALITATGGPPHTREVDRPLATALEARGVEVDRPVWDDPTVAWGRYDAAVVRTTWDYAPRREQFVAWAQQADEATRLWNPAEVIRWNTHKSYLIELEERGAPVVPTAWLGAGDTVHLPALLDSRGWHDAVVKPAIGAGSGGVMLVDGSRTAAEQQARLDRLLADGDVLVQPYLPAVETRGELSVVVIDGAPTHAVRKLPSAGEFRVQRTFGGDEREEALDPDVAALAAWVVEATGTDLLQARVDLIEDPLGVLQLVELELTEPDLYLRVVPAVAERVADAIVRRAQD